MKRRTLLTALAASPVLAATGAAAAVPSASTGVGLDEAVRILLGNIYMPATQETLVSLIADINLKVADRLIKSGIIDPQFVMSSPVQVFGRHTVTAQSRRLDTLYRCEIDDETMKTNTSLRSEISASLANDIATEVETEMGSPRNANIQFCPYMLVVSSGIILDLKTFEPTVAFMIRYGLFDRAASVGSEAVYPYSGVNAAS